MKDSFSIQEVMQILENVGIDTTCGACMCLAMTGHIELGHTCQTPPPMLVTITPGKPSNSRRANGR